MERKTAVVSHPGGYSVMINGSAYTTVRSVSEAERVKACLDSYPAGVIPTLHELLDVMRTRAPHQRPVTPTARSEGSAHYTGMDVQPWDVIDTWPREQQIGFYRGNLLKYTMRMGTKDAAPQEIKKAEHYAKKLREVLAK